MRIFAGQTCSESGAASNAVRHRCVTPRADFTRIIADFIRPRVAGTAMAN